MGFEFPTHSQSDRLQEKEWRITTGGDVVHPALHQPRHLLHQLKPFGVPLLAILRSQQVFGFSFLREHVGHHAELQHPVEVVRNQQRRRDPRGSNDQSPEMTARQSSVLGTLAIASKVMNCCGDPITSQHSGVPTVCS